MRNILLFIIFQVLTISCFQKSFAFDPLVSEKDIPGKYYNFYMSDEALLLESCAVPDLEKENINIFIAINLALCQNPQTKISWYAIKRQAANNGLAESAYLPTVNISASRDRVTDNFDDKTLTATKAINFQWLLFDFGKRAADKDQQYFALIQTAYQHNDTLQRFIYSVIQSYSNLFSAGEVVKAAIRAEESYKVAYEVAEEKYKLGLVAWADVLKAQTNYSQSILARQKAENDQQINKGSFIQIINMPQGTQVNLDPPEFLDKSFLLEKNILSLIDIAMKNRPDLKALIAKEKSLKAQSKSAKSDRFPKISLYGGRQLREVQGGIDQNENNIGITLTFPFFSGFQKTYNINKAEADYKTAIEQRQQTESQLAFDVWKAYQNFKTAQQMVKTSEKLLKSAKESKNVAFGGYKVGRSSMLDVLSAEAEYANAEKEKIFSEYNNFISGAALLLAIGQLNQQELSNEKSSSITTQ